MSTDANPDTIAADLSRRGFVATATAVAASGLSLAQATARTTQVDMASLPPYGNGTLPPSIRSRVIAGVNGMNVHILEAGHETPGRPALLLHELHAAARRAPGRRRRSLGAAGAAREGVRAAARLLARPGARRAERVTVFALPAALAAELGQGAWPLHRSPQDTDVTTRVAAGSRSDDRAGEPDGPPPCWLGSTMMYPAFVAPTDIIDTQAAIDHRYEG